MAARIAKGLAQLRAQVNVKWPKRSTASDGWIGDVAHAARPSDHNPDARGIVHALDLTHDPANGFDSWKFADMLLRRQDPRLKYVISNGRIGSGPSGTQPGKWRKYTGANAHAHHVHFSITEAGEDDVQPWAFDEVVVKPVPSAEPTLKRELAYGMSGEDVKELQVALGLPSNGYFGYGTAAAVVKVQLEAGLAAHGIVGPGTWKIIKEKMNV
jgi:peptidoglycan hydrolase-like protein with peptidoglycan-binding domain